MMKETIATFVLDWVTFGVSMRRTKLWMRIWEWSWLGKSIRVVGTRLVAETVTKR
jgi:hypothetical protein